MMGYFSTAACSNRSIRLVKYGQVVAFVDGGSGSGSGYDSNENPLLSVAGRVEVCYGGMWGTVCDDLWCVHNLVIILKVGSCILYC